MSELITFGESLLRFSARRGERLSSASTLDFYIGGSELNIAANAQALGLKTRWVSVLPDSELGTLIFDRIARLDVDLQDVVRANGRVGWYLMEQGAAPRPDFVFERSKSLVADQKTFSFAWSQIFAGAKAFHTSGITAGLSEVCTDECAKAMKAARAAGVLVSYDFNFRKNIWSFEESVRRQTPLMNDVDILFASPAEMKAVFGLSETPDKTWLETLSSRGLPLKAVVLTARSVNEGEYGIDVVTREGVVSSRRFPISNVDRIGVGDAMAAAFLAGVIARQEWSAVADSAAAAGALKYSINGDMALLKNAELQHLLASGYKGIVR